MDIVHATLTADNSRLPLFRDEAAYNEGLHRIARICGDRICLFALLAEHIHLELLVTANEAARLCRATILSLAPIVSTPLAPSYRRPVSTRRHARWLFRYFLDQPARHKLSGTPALFVGSCLPDLVGARCVPGLAMRIAEVMPEFRPELALERLGLPPDPLTADAETLRAAGLSRLKQATAAVLALSPALDGKRASAVRARRTLIEIGRKLGFNNAEVCGTLGMSSRAARRLRATTPFERPLARAVSARIALENLVHRTQQAEPVPVGASGYGSISEGRSAR